MFGKYLPFFVIAEPTQISNHPVLNHVTPVIEDAKNSKEASHALDNEQVSVAEKVVITNHQAVSNQNDAHPVKETAASKTQEEALKKSFASVVRTCVQSTVTTIIEHLLMFSFYCGSFRYTI